MHLTVGGSGQAHEFLRERGTNHPRFPRPRRLAGFSASRAVLAAVMVCTVVPMALFYAGRFAVAGRCFWVLAGAALMGFALMAGPELLLAFLIAVAPLINLLRSFAFFNVVIVLYAAALFLCFVRDPSRLSGLFRQFPWLGGVSALAVVFYAASFLNTGRYSSNLRVFELLFALVTILLLRERPKLLASALLGLVVSACTVGFAMLPHLDTTERLGMVRVDDPDVPWTASFGNPIQLGLPLSLGFLALVIDGGRWLQLQTRPLWRVALLLPTTALLVLTTSRAAWLATAVGLTVSFAWGKRQRFKLLAGGLVVLAAVLAVLTSEYGDAVRRGYEHTFGEDRTLAQRSTGRSDQWTVAWRAFTSSAGSSVHGYGPGVGSEAYARVSATMAVHGAGSQVALHSLFMQVVVETGLLGLVPLVALLAAAGVRVFRRTAQSGIVLPWACFLGFLLVAMTVTGFDTVSGVMLGLGLTVTSKSHRTNTAARLTKPRSFPRIRAGMRSQQRRGPAPRAKAEPANDSRQSTSRVNP